MCGQFYLPGLFMTREDIRVLILLLIVTKQTNCIQRISDFNERQSARQVGEGADALLSKFTSCFVEAILFLFARLGEA